MTDRGISVLSYMHEGSKVGWSIDQLGNEPEITVPPENVLMDWVAYHLAKKSIAEGQDVQILTLGGAAITNAALINRMSEVFGQSAVAIPLPESYSIATNIASLSAQDGLSDFTVICQKFAKRRTGVHCDYYLPRNSFSIIDWESYIAKNPIDGEERDMIEELVLMCGVPRQRLAAEHLLLFLACIDPKTGMMSLLGRLRKLARDNDPDNNPFNLSGLS